MNMEDQWHYLLDTYSTKIIEKYLIYLSTINFLIIHGKGNNCRDTIVDAFDWGATPCYSLWCRIDDQLIEDGAQEIFIDALLNYLQPQIENLKQTKPELFI